MRLLAKESTMRLLLHVVLRLAAVVLLCLAAAIGWILIETHRASEAETAASAERVALALENLYWRELLWRGGLDRAPLLPAPQWDTIATLTLIAPGICVSFAAGPAAPRRLCSQTEGVGRPAAA
jgi:two-component system, NarL family, sensor histidine kinase UhpB